MRTLQQLHDDALTKENGTEEKVYFYQYIVPLKGNVKMKVLSLSAYGLIRTFSKNSLNTMDDPDVFISVQHRKSREIWLLNPVTNKQFKVNLLLGIYDVGQ